MPRFHVNVFNVVDAADEEGVERLSLEAATSEAIAGARELIASHIKSGEPVYRSHRLEITNENGAILHTVRFGDVIDLRP